MIILKSKQEIEKMRASNAIVAEVLVAMLEACEPGVTPLDLDRMAEEMLKARKAKPAFKGYHGYPNSICASVNEVVVHGIPSKKPLVSGDIISLDFGVVYEGYVGDAAFTIGIGEISPEAEKLLEVTEAALYAGIEQARPGNRLRDISRAIEATVAPHGYGIVRDFVGHGIGRRMHEDPQVPNYDTGRSGPRLKRGMVLALEPMINLGTWEVEVLADGWTAVTKDRSLSAHFEHSIAITEDGPDILSRFPRDPRRKENR